MTLKDAMLSLLKRDRRGDQPSSCESDANDPNQFNRKRMEEREREITSRVSALMELANAVQRNDTK
jgi:hypothetical protein